MNELYDFLFEFTEESECEGEQFLVECGTLDEAWEILREYDFEDGEVRYLYPMTVEEGEMLGLDTY